MIDHPAVMPFQYRHTEVGHSEKSPPSDSAGSFETTKPVPARSAASWQTGRGIESALRNLLAKTDTPSAHTPRHSLTNRITIDQIRRTDLSEAVPRKALRELELLGPEIRELEKVAEDALHLISDAHRSKTTGLQKCAGNPGNPDLQVVGMHEKLDRLYEQVHAAILTAKKSGYHGAKYNANIDVAELIDYVTILTEQARENSHHEDARHAARCLKAYKDAQAEVDKLGGKLKKTIREYFALTTEKRIVLRNARAGKHQELLKTAEATRDTSLIDFRLAVHQAAMDFGMHSASALISDHIKAYERKSNSICRDFLEQQHGRDNNTPLPDNIFAIARAVSPGTVAEFIAAHENFKEMAMRYPLEFDSHPAPEGALPNKLSKAF